MSRVSFAAGALAMCVLPLVGGASVMADARVDYMLNCMGCHLQDGAGMPGRVPPLQGMGRFLRAPGGRNFLVQVPGVAQSALSDEDLAEVLNWILVNFSKDELPEPFVPYTAQEVAGARAERLVDVGAARAALLREVENP